ncbi:hypothetical protein RUM44_004778 [Polyplax serrata]|uniref:Uncharacterized protein n=1 Tax=Polyplax serrata TaxID=468196 RepID=A0ABR1B3V0_POLSC
MAGSVPNELSSPRSEAICLPRRKNTKDGMKRVGREGVPFSLPLADGKQKNSNEEDVDEERWAPTSIKYNRGRGGGKKKRVQKSRAEEKVGDDERKLGVKAFNKNQLIKMGRSFNLVERRRHLLDKRKD